MMIKVCVVVIISLIALSDIIPLFKKKEKKTLAIYLPITLFAIFLIIKYRNIEYKYSPTTIIEYLVNIIKGVFK